MLENLGGKFLKKNYNSIESNIEVSDICDGTSWATAPGTEIECIWESKAKELRG
jgi:hypothetical protein